MAKHIAIALENAILFEEISREKKEWERTFDAITDMVWIEDGKRRIVRANRTLLQQTGFSAADITGRDCDEALERLGIASTPCLCDKTREGRRPSSREFKNAAGSDFQFWAYPLIDEEGKLYAIVHYLKDVTGQKRMEQQLIRSERLASLGTLVAGIAHEINNPLGIIAGYAEALLDRADDPGFAGLRRVRGFPGVPPDDPPRDLPLQEHPAEPAGVRAALGRNLPRNRRQRVDQGGSPVASAPHGAASAPDRPAPDPRAAEDQRRRRQPAAGADEPAAQRDLLHAGGRGHHHHDRGRGPRRNRAAPERQQGAADRQGHGGRDRAGGRRQIFDPFFTTKPVERGPGSA